MKAKLDDGGGSMYEILQVVINSPGMDNRGLSLGIGGPNWVATDDGKTIYSTTVETATVSSGQLLLESSAQHFDTAKPVTSFSLVVPGFHDIGIDGKAPTQLRGFTTSF